MKPFNLEAAKAGKPLITRGGEKVKFIAHVPEATEGNRLVILHEGCPRGYFANGNFYASDESDLDLFMDVQEITVWLNCYPDGSASCWKTKEEADQYAEHVLRIGGARPFTYTLE